MAIDRSEHRDKTMGPVGAIAPKTSANTLIVATIIIAFLYIARSILMPIALAVLLAFVLTPPVRFLRRCVRLPQVMSVLLIVLVCFSSLIGAGLLVAKQVNVLAENIPRYEYALREKLKTLRGATMQGAAVKQAAETIKDLGAELSKPDEKTGGQKPTTIAGDQPDTLRKNAVPVVVMKPSPSPVETYGELILTLLEPLAMTGLVFLFLTFILLQRQDLRDRLIRLAGGQDLERTTSAMTEAGERLSRFFLIQLILNSVYGAAVGIALWAIGVPNPILWAGLAFLMRYVPYIGSVLAAIFPLILAAAVDPTWNTFFWTLALYAVGETLMGQVFEPLAFGNNTGLSSFAVIISATLWTSLWGPLGLVLAVPLTLLLVTFSKHVEQLSFLNVMFGDQPALSPIERFYQRALASDPIEATELAEQFAKEKSLLAFYDDVALGALRLAQEDHERGALDDRKMVTIVNTLDQVSDDLSSADDGAGQAISADGDDASEKQLGAAQPALPALSEDQLADNWRSGSPILCVSGRSTLDVAAADMMVHLLTTQGLAARQMGFSNFATSNLSSLDMSGVQIVVLSYLGTGKGTAHIRGLIKRIRRACPNAKIIAGLWNAEAETSEFNAGAERTAHSFRMALEYCVEEAVEAASLFSQRHDRTSSERPVAQ